MPLDLYCSAKSSFQIWNLLAVVIGGLLIKKVGRRTLFIVSSAGMLTCQYLQSFTTGGIMLMTSRTAFSVWSLTTSLFHTNSITVATNGWVEPSSDCTLLTISLFPQLPFHSFSYSIYSIMWLIRQCLSHIHRRFFPSPYEQRGLHSWFVMSWRVHSPSVTLHLLRFPKNLTVSLSMAFNQFVDPWALDVIGWKYVGVSLYPRTPYLINHSTSSTVHGCVLN